MRVLITVLELLRVHLFNSRLPLATLPHLIVPCLRTQFSLFILVFPVDAADAALRIPGWCPLSRQRQVPGGGVQRNFQGDV